MSSNDEKRSREIRIFEDFLVRSRMFPAGAAVEGRPDGEPDVLCTPHGAASVAFELTELCDSNVAEVIRARDCTRKSAAFWTSDPSTLVVLAKLSKRYVSQHPIHLLVYTDGRIVTPDSVIISTLLNEIDFGSQTTFQSVWFMGERIVKKLFEAT